MAGHPQSRGLGLLMDLFEHEVPETALVRHVLGATQQRGGALHPSTGGVIQLDAQGCQQGHLAVFHRQDRAGESRQRRGVAGTQEFTLTQADQQRRRPAGHHQGSGGLGPDQRQGIGPMQQRQHLLHRLQQQVAASLSPSGLERGQAVCNQVGDHLGIGVAAEHHTTRLQLFAQGAVVLNDAVLDHRQLTAAVEVGVRIALFRFAMGGPTGVPNAAQARSPLGLVTGRQVDEFAFGPQAMQPGTFTGTFNSGDTGRVVTPVFELPETIQELRRSLARTDQGNDAAHRRSGMKKARHRAGLELM